MFLMLGILAWSSTSSMPAWPMRVTNSLDGTITS